MDALHEALWRAAVKQLKREPRPEFDEELAWRRYSNEHPDHANLFELHRQFEKALVR